MTLYMYICMYVSTTHKSSLVNLDDDSLHHHYWRSRGSLTNFLMALVTTRHPPPASYLGTSGTSRTPVAGRQPPAAPYLIVIDIYVEYHVSYVSVYRFLPRDSSTDGLDQKEDFASRSNLWVI